MSNTCRDNKVANNRMISGGHLKQEKLVPVVLQIRVDVPVFQSTYQ